MLHRCVIESEGVKQLIQRVIIEMYGDCPHDPRTVYQIAGELLDVFHGEPDLLSDMSYELLLALRTARNHLRRTVRRYLNTVYSPYSFTVLDSYGSVAIIIRV